MPLPSFQQWRESSPTTRNKAAAAQGLQPMYSADVFGHATPPPAVANKLLELLKKDKKSKKKKKEDDLPFEEKVMTPNYEIDDFIRKAKKVRDQIDDEVEKGNKKSKDLDDKKTKKQKEADAKKKAAPKPAPKKPVVPPQYPFSNQVNANADDLEDDERSDIEKQNEAYNWEAYLD